MDVIFVPAKWKGKVSKDFFEKIAEALNVKKVAIVSTVQFLDLIPKLKSFLESKGFEVLVGKPKYRALEEGQVLGCDPSAAHVNAEAYIFLGNGNFHPLMISLETGKAVLIADPLSNIVSYFDEAIKEKYLKRKKAAFSKFLLSEKVGILLSIKPGQFQPSLAKKAKEVIEKKGKRAYFFVADTIDPHSLSDFADIDFWVNTACPRLAIDDYDKFEKPVLNVSDLLSLLGENDG